MLREFTVSNYRSFHKPIRLNLTNVRDYQFNEECVQNGVITKAIIYGKNAVGKTNLSEALFDIKTMAKIPNSHLRYSLSPMRAEGFLHAYAEEKVAKFSYTVQLPKGEIVYTYEKKGPETIHYESLSINEDVLYTLNFTTGESDFSAFQNYPELALLNLENWQPDTSVLKYILSHAKLQELSILLDFNYFVKNMINLQSIIETYPVTPSHVIGDWVARITKNRLEKEFQQFLNDAGIPIHLTVEKTPDGREELYIDYGKKLLLFRANASSGTLKLAEHLLISMLLHDGHFIFIDEFDSNFHFGLAKMMLEQIKKYNKGQIIMTTHNTDLMSNKFMRPDCYLLMSEGKITSLADATKRDLRQGHNLDSVYPS